MASIRNEYYLLKAAEKQFYGRRKKLIINPNNSLINFTILQRKQQKDSETSCNCWNYRCESQSTITKYDIM